MDHLSDGSDSDLIAYVQPAKAMKYNSHYVVIIQGLTDSNDQLLPASSLFQEWCFI